MATPKDVMRDMARGIDNTMDNLRNMGYSMTATAFGTFGLQAPPLPPAPPSLEQLVGGIPDIGMPPIPGTAMPMAPNGPGLPTEVIEKSEVALV